MSKVYRGLVGTLYASTAIGYSGGGWGDGMTAFIFCEYLKQHNPHLEIHLLDIGSRQRVRDGSFTVDGSPVWRHRYEIERPSFVDSFVDLPPDIDRFTYILSTHHNTLVMNKKHKVDPLVPKVYDLLHGGLLPPGEYHGRPPDPARLIYMDANVEVTNLLRFVQFFPTLPRLVPELALDWSKLPAKFIAIQLRRDEPKEDRERNFYSGVDFDRWIDSFVVRLYKKHQLRIIVLSGAEYLSPYKFLLDASHLSLWQKIHVAARAEALYVHQSGFGMICGCYSNWQNFKLINARRNSWAPPLAFFPNCKIDPSVSWFTPGAPDTFPEDFNKIELMEEETI